jgi:hypothetical protein
LIIVAKVDMDFGISWIVALIPSYVGLALLMLYSIDHLTQLGFFSADHIDTGVMRLIMDFSCLLLLITWAVLFANFMDGNLKQHLASYVIGSISITVICVAKAKTVGDWAFQFLVEPLTIK